jgi:uncharacterized membrane protein YphA (DoxX/SURF4 family)
MKLPTHGSLDLSALRMRAERSCVIDTGDPGAERSVAARTNTTRSNNQHLKAAGVSALVIVEKMIVWTISVLLAAFFLIVGALKLSNPAGVTGGLSRWSNPTLLYLFARAVEIVGAVTLLIPRWACFGAASLAAMMAGGFVSHLTHNESSEAIVPSVLVALLGIIAYAGRRR